MRSACNADPWHNNGSKWKELIRSRPAFTVSLVPGGIPKDSQEVFDYLKIY